MSAFWRKAEIDVDLLCLSTRSINGLVNANRLFNSLFKNNAILVVVQLRGIEFESRRSRHVEC